MFAKFASLPKAIRRRISRSQGQLKRRSLRFEGLENRQMMAADATTIYLDFGYEFQPELSSPNAGPSPSDLPAGEFYQDSEQPEPGQIGIPELGRWVRAFKSVEGILDRWGVDYNGDGVAGERADADDLASDVLSLVRRTYEPFNVIVETAAATNWQDVVETLRDNVHSDAYVLLGVQADTSAGSDIVGISTQLRHTNGDIGHDDGNNFDDVVFVFSENMGDTEYDSPDFLSGIIPKQATKGDPYLIATGLARVAAHEAAHSFGLEHLLYDDSDAGSIAGSELMAIGDAEKLSKPQIALRGWEFEPYHTADELTPDDTPNSYVELANTLGLRPGAPAYVTGSGLHDRIHIYQTGGDTARVYVTAYWDAAHTVFADRTSYYISTANGVLIEGATGDDIITANVNTPVILRGGYGSDKLVGTRYDDVLMGEAGSDILIGGRGDDTYVFAHTKISQGRETIDTIQEHSNDPSYGGVDTLDFSDFRAPIIVDIAAVHVDGKWQQVTKSKDHMLGLQFLITPEKFRNPEYTALSNGLENVVGTDFNDRIYGNMYNNHLSGGAGTDRIYGRSGHDTLLGGRGLDYLYGEQGNDWLDGGVDASRDYLYGGSGRDSFVKRSDQSAVVDDIFADFQSRYDYIYNTMFSDGGKRR